MKECYGLHKEPYVYYPREGSAMHAWVSAKSYSSPFGDDNLPVAAWPYYTVRESDLSRMFHRGMTQPPAYSRDGASRGPKHNTGQTWAVLSALEPAAHGTGKNPDQVAVLVTASALLVSYPDDMMRSLSNSSSLAGATGRRISQDFLQYSANDI